MALSNRDRIGKGLELTASGLRPFVERELKSRLGANWERTALENQRGPNQSVNWNDPQILLSVLWDQWNSVFRESLGPSERSLVSELKGVRNQWAHNEQFSGNDGVRALDSMERLLNAVSAGDKAAEVGQMRMDLMRVIFDEQRRSEMRKKSYQPTEGKPQGGLKSWREVATPHPDVASGRYQQAEFAADLWQVYLGEGTDEYRHPTEFFRRTYLTDSLRRLLVSAAQRLTGHGGDPVVQLQTNFGGGKTHSMLALYHLFSGTAPTELPGVEPVLQEELLLVMAPQHPLAHKRHIVPKDLVRQPFVLFEAGSNSRRTIEEFFARQQITPKVVTETENVEIIKAMVRVRLGISVIPYQAMAREVAAGQLACARIVGQTLTRETGWVHPRSARLPRAVVEMKRMLDVVAPRLKLLPDETL